MAYANELLNAETTPAERALIKAIQSRFPDRHPASHFAIVDQSYACAMEEVYRELGAHDMDVATLITRSQGPASVRHRAAAARRGHPSGHLASVDSLHVNVLHSYRCSAVAADEKYLAKKGGKNFYSFYRLHNYHSLIYTGMLAGQLKVVRRALDQMEISITDDLLRVESPPLADWMEFFKAVRVHAYIRLGLWEEVIALPLPADQVLYCVTTTMIHYGKGIAWAAMGKVEEADRERTLYHTAAKTVPPSRKDFPNLIHDVFKVATAMLEGEIEYRRGDYTRAFQSLREAIHWDDNLRYTEPWGWMVPSRHAYAALMLEQGNVEEAALRTLD
ncbi:uncharacterized protein KD926_006855 [Aspergillus affinis]|uniref:uncharacterized protein n=1 Tax=Aspergillus affinis TaxID=1070780 RepID=UPI0022FE2347|nr:uncharacterized protein KD926_006855 [Aspergillus affinis]KAI9041459.1 hypothetical protein KD926_006855 [Aspergillus affinis]